MKFLRKIRWLLLSLAIIALGVYLFIQYDKIRFLSYGALHIKQKPSTAKIINCDEYGLSDWRYECYLSIDPTDLPTLLSGRKYHPTLKAKDYFNSWAANSHKYNFVAYTCYTAGDLSHGLVNIFVNKENTKAYVVYDVQ